MRRIIDDLIENIAKSYEPVAIVFGSLFICYVFYSIAHQIYH